MLIQLLPDLQYYLITHLRHQVHPDFYQDNERNIKHCCQDTELYEPIGTFSDYMYIYCPLDDKRIYYCYAGTDTHDHSDQSDQPLVFKQVLKQSGQSFCFTLLFQIFILLCSITRHVESLPSLM